MTATRNTPSDDEQNAPPNVQAQPAKEEQPASAKQRSNGKNTVKVKRQSRPWLNASICTLFIVLIAYVLLFWTDPEQVAMRQRAWTATMEKFKKKEVVHAQRYSPEFKYRPAASPVLTETLKDGRKRLRGGRWGDDMPVPTLATTSPTPTRKPRRKNKKKH